MGRRSTEELINQIGGERGRLSPKEERGEVAAVKELGERLGFTGFENEDQEARLEQARESGQDPGRFFGEEINRLDAEIRRLTEQLKDIENEQAVVYPRAGEDFVAVSERITEDKKARAETVRAKLEQLNFDRSRANQIIEDLGNGDLRSALQDLEVRINRVQRDLIELDRQATGTAQDKEIKAEKDYLFKEQRSLRAIVKNLELYKK